MHSNVIRLAHTYNDIRMYVLEMKAFSACYCVDSFEQWTLNGLPVHPLLRIFVAMTTHASSWAVL